MSENPAGTILIVDDELDILASMTDLFHDEIHGIHVLTATSAQKALKLLKPGNVDLIITDYKMPGMDGLQFLALVRRDFPNVPAIMMTAYPDPKVAARAVKDLHVGLFLAKPFDLAYVVDLVRGILASRHDAAGA